MSSLGFYNIFIYLSFPSGFRDKWWWVRIIILFLDNVFPVLYVDPGTCFIWQIHGDQI